jgi:integrase
VNHVKAFFEYMALEGLLKKKHARKAIKAIRLSEKDRRSAQGRKPVKFHTIAQYKDAVAAMPMGNPSERRDRALMAFLPVSGARDGAIISLNVEHVDFEQSLIVQDPNIVKTKAGKWIITTFFPVGDELIGEVKDYIDYLKTDLHTTDTDPLFPSTARAYDENDRFCSGGNLTKEKWSNAQPVREIVRAAFAAINLPYVKPHSIRHTLGRLSYDLGLEQEEVRAWSQNYGHENISTTYDNYGPISQDRKHTKILGLHNKKPKSQMATNPPDTVGLKELLREVLREELGSP